jgi:transcriptional regulator with XRE-family HTH domain
MPGDIRKDLGGRLRKARKTRLKGVSLEQFGRQVAELMQRPRAFSNVTVSNWETGRQEPSWEAMVAIARLTRLPLRYFAGAGDLDDYPLEYWSHSGRDVLDRRLRTLVAAAQRLSPAQRRLIVMQLESLIEALRQEHAGGLLKERAQERAG